MVKKDAALGLVAAVALAAVGCFGEGVAGTASIKPNVVIILVDDLGVADVSFNSRHLNDGFAAIETPELDSLALDEQGGLHLTRSITHIMCGPSRSALITGRISHRLGNPFAMLGRNSEGITILGGSLDKKYNTIAHEFRERGYSTHFVGKWGIDYARPSEEASSVLGNPEVFNGREAGYGPTERGFDTFYGLMSSGHNHFTKELVYTGAVDWHKHNKTHKLDYPELDHEPTEYSTHLFTREAIAALDEWTPEHPGFLHLSYTAPHDPLQAPKQYLDSPSCAAMQNWRRRTFCGMVVAVDEGVGQLRQALRDRSLDHSTVILFSSDNGGAPAVGGFNYPYKGQKATVYEGGVRSPAFIHVPKGLIPKKRANRYRGMIHISDFGPTLLGLVDRASGRAPGILNRLSSGYNTIDGMDHTEFLLASLNGESLHRPASFNDLADDEQSPRDSVVVEFNAFMKHAAYVEGDMKLILGNAGRADRFLEPNGTCFDANNRMQNRVKEFLCDLIDLGLGENWFAYSWAFRFMVDLAVKNLQPGKKDTIMRSSINLAVNAEFGDTIPITEENLPRANWDDYDLGHVQLYNLKNDPYEDSNIALDNTQLVEEMAARLRNQVSYDEGHNFSVQKKFMGFMINIVACLAVVVFVLVAAISVLCAKALCGAAAATSSSSSSSSGPTTTTTAAAAAAAATPSSDGDKKLN